MDTVILKRADHFQTRAVANMGQSRISVASEVSLKNISSWSPVENGAPRFQLTDARRGLFRMDFGHTPDVQVLAPAHRIRETTFPFDPCAARAQRYRNATIGHNLVLIYDKLYTHQPPSD